MTTVAVHRIGRKPDPWEYPDWSRANPDRTFGNRFDDPNGEYRVLYASSRRLGCFVETLARYRPDLVLYTELQDIDGEDDFLPLGTVPREWFDSRVIGSAEAHGNFADIGAAEWVAILRRSLAAVLVDLGVSDFDAAVLQQTGPRILTQRVSEYCYSEGFDGIRYLSKYGHNIENWALFEPARLTSVEARRIRQDDPDLIEALRILDLKLE